MKVAACISIALLVSDCVAIKSTEIDLDEGFSNHAEVFHIKTPVLRIPDSVFEREFGESAVTGFDLSAEWKAGEEPAATRIRENLLGALLFDQSLYITEKNYRVSHKQVFSFNLQSAQAESKVNCMRWSLQRQIQTKGFDDSDYSTKFDGGGLASSLSCNIKQNSKIWKLELFNLPTEQISLSLESESGDQYILKPNYSGRLLLSDGRPIERQSFSDQQYIYAIEIYRKNRQVAAVSTSGKSRIWLANDLTDHEKSVLLSATYSLTVFNWLDDHWNGGLREMP